jgi:hypothetical protein
VSLLFPDERVIIERDRRDRRERSRSKSIRRGRRGEEGKGDAHSIRDPV